MTFIHFNIQDFQFQKLQSQGTLKEMEIENTRLSKRQPLQKFQFSKNLFYEILLSKCSTTTSLQLYPPYISTFISYNFVLTQQIFKMCSINNSLSSIGT